MDAATNSIPVTQNSVSTNSILPLQLENAGLRLNGHELLADINLTFSESGLTIILGPNGAGKTLLLKLCHGLHSPTSGKVRWAQPDCIRNPRAQSMVFQRPVILRRTVKANIEYALRVCGVDRQLHEQCLNRAIDLAGLTEMASRPAKVLSGGEQQRLTLARAWAIHPEVLFLDEPTAHLDPSATRNIEQMISSIKDSGTKIIMTTHDLGQARRLGDDIVFLNRGRVLEQDTSTAFFAEPKTPEAKAFVNGDLLW